MINKTENSSIINTKGMAQQLGAQSRPSGNDRKSQPDYTIIETIDKRGLVLTNVGVILCF